jgi:hypothetical protein
VYGCMGVCEMLWMYVDLVSYPVVEIQISDEGRINAFKTT